MALNMMGGVVFYKQTRNQLLHLAINAIWFSSDELGS